MNQFLKRNIPNFLKKLRNSPPLEDFPYTALALRYKSSGLDVRIWSNDPEFREMVENRVPVVSTSELKEELEVGFTTTP